MWARFAFFLARNMRPRSVKRLGANGEPILEAKPPSAYGPIYGWRRILSDAGHELPDMKLVARTIKGETAKYKAKWGSKAVVPTRRLPFSQPMLQRIHECLVRGDVRAATGKEWTPQQCRVMRAAFLFGLATGERADSMAASSTGDIDYWRADDLVFVRGERELEPHERPLPGDLLRGRAPPSKCDRDNMEWGDRDMWFRYNPADPLNFAAAWAAYMDTYRATGGAHGAAAFSPSEDGNPFNKAHLQRDFNDLLVSALGADEAKRRSWHALRVTAATALNTAKRPDGAIQCVLRWKTVDAMRLYAKMNRQQYADLVEEITTTPIEVTRARALPALGHEDVVSELNALGELLEGDHATAAIAPAKSAAAAPAPAAASQQTRAAASDPQATDRRGTKRPRRAKELHQAAQPHQGGATRRDSGTARTTPAYSCINFPSSLEGYIIESQRPSTRRAPTPRPRS
jgi:hypothetical protein